MITITQDDGVVTLINVFSCEPKNRQHLIAAWIRATEETLGKLPGIISATLHRSKDGTRVVNYAQWLKSRPSANSAAVAPGTYAIPKFEAAAFSFSGGRLELQVAIIYL